MKKILQIIILTCFIFTLSFSAHALDSYNKMDNLDFIIDFEFKEFPKNPVNTQGRILLPMRDFFETIGATVEWNEELKEIYASYEDNKIFLKIGSKDSIVNGNYQPLDVSPTLIDNTTYVPIRFAAEALGYEIIWNEDFRTIYAFSNYEELDTPKIIETSSVNNGIPSDTRIVDSFSGIGSWYGGKFHGRKTSSGEVFDQNAFTGAHRTLPFGTFVRVTHNYTNESVVIRINDRGPHVAGRVVDLSMAAAESIGLRSRGLGEVYVEVLENYY